MVLLVPHPVPRRSWEDVVVVPLVPHPAPPRFWEDVEGALRRQLLRLLQCPPLPVPQRGHRRRDPPGIR